MTIVKLFPADIYNQKTIQQGHPPDWTNREGGEYDLVVLGGGPAGLVAAITAATGGHRVAMTEQRLTGGTCVNLRSQQRFAAAQASGKFEDEIIAVEVAGRKGPTLFETDEHNRPETTLRALSALKPAFRPDGTITAGNAPGFNSGAAALVRVSHRRPLDDLHVDRHLSLRSTDGEIDAGRHSSRAGAVAGATRFNVTSKRFPGV